MAVLVLGPSKWRAGNHPSLPECVSFFLPEDWPVRGTHQLTPLDLRAALVGALVRAECRATMMEMQVPEPGETHTALFQRLVRDLPVDRYLLYWPYGSQRAGLDVEIGFLLAQFEAGACPDVRVLVQAGAHAAGRIEGGDFIVLEGGRRTRYYEDLVRYGCPIVEWEDSSALWSAVLEHGRVAPEPIPSPARRAKHGE